jgi:hypothetical protein
VDAGVGAGVVNVSTGSGCAWTAISTVPWITIATGASGTGNGIATFTVAANPGAARSGTIAVAGQSFTVTQAATVAPTCTFAITPTTQTVDASASGGSVSVSTATACTWTASSNVPWLIITSGAIGTGNGSVAFNVAANAGASRTGTMTIAGQTFTVTQAAPVVAVCTYSITPTTHTVSAGANGGFVNVTAGGGCTWTAISNAPWLIITSGATGIGNGSVSFNISANTGPARTGTMTIAGQTFTETQAAPVVPACTYSTSPPSLNVNAIAGTGVVTVSTTANCTWTASTSATWITITSGATGSGSGSVVFAIAANSGNARVGAITVAGNTTTVQQGGGGPGPGSLR